MFSHNELHSLKTIYEVPTIVFTQISKGEIMMNQLKITSVSFLDNEYIPKKHTGFAEDISPEFQLHHISDKAASVAIIMDDLDVPFNRAFNHWVIWNIPRMDVIPENIPYGSSVSSLGGAIQGVGYGVNRYRGPKPPFIARNRHRYIFRFFVLDCFLDLDCSAKKGDLIEAMQGHILQEGSLTGKYKR